ncbi:Probable terpene synthase 3 [Linum grandiflorum]
MFITLRALTQVVEEWNERIEALKPNVARKLLSPTTKEELPEKLNLVDVVQRLGIGYHFEEEIQQLLQQVYDDNENVDYNLETVSLRFRLLRQHGFDVPSDIFKNFKTEDGEFKEELVKDIEGILNLYEAGYMRKQEEDILDEAIQFTKSHLDAAIMVKELDSTLADRISHALERPLRKGVPKVEQLFFISVYEQMQGHDATLLTLAKLSFNVLQNMYQKELKLLTKWDTSMKGVNRKMKLLFEATDLLCNELDSINSKDGRPYCLEYLKLANKNMVKLYLEEARWLANSYVPTLDEYRKVSSLSTVYQGMVCAAVCGLGELATKQVFDWIFTDPKILLASSDHCRLMDDIVTHEFEQERGHAASSVECYMTHYGVSRKEAVDALNEMVEEDWKIVNEELLNPANDCIPKEVLLLFLAFEQVMNKLYKYSDGYTHSNGWTKDMLTDLLVTPLPTN